MCKEDIKEPIGKDGENPVEEPEHSPEQKEQEREDIKDFGATRVDNGIQIISIIGQIEGHQILPPQNKTTKYEHLIPIITNVAQKEEAEGILVVINTLGGDVEAGLAIAELIRGLHKPSVSLVLGGGHSIGVPLSVCTDYSFIAPTASMTIHPLRTTGVFIASPQNFAYYIKMQERIIHFISSNTTVSEQKVIELMNNKNQLADDVGTVLIGEQAVDIGLIDAVGGISEALEKLKALINAKR